MPYVRVSLMRSKDASSAEAGKIVDDLIGYMSKQPGYVTGWRMTAQDGTGLLGRITIWNTEADADHAAQYMRDHLATSLQNTLDIAADSIA